MPHCDTRYFGVLEYSEAAVLDFPEGLPGFPSEKRFILIEQPPHHPLVFLQSLSCRDLCFLAVPVQCVEPDYRPVFAAEDLAELGFSREAEPRLGADLLCLAIVFVGEEGSATANLLAPVVVNLHNRRAVQAVQAEQAYSHRHPLALLEAARCS
jgi:flagellar assembly factor FliW